MIHYVEEDNNAFIQIRPYAEDFIETMFNFFEIVVFTAAMKDVRLTINFPEFVYTRDFQTHLEQNIKVFNPYQKAQK